MRSHFCLLAFTALIFGSYNSRIHAQELSSDRLYTQGKSALHELRWQIFGVRDLVADARSESDLVNQEYFRKRARRTLKQAKASAAKLKALIDAEAAKAEEGDQTSSYTLAAMRQQYDAYAKWLADAETEVAALESAAISPAADSHEDDQPDDDEAAVNLSGTNGVPLPPPIAPVNETISTTGFPTGDDLIRQSRILMRIDTVLHEIYLAQAHARSTYHRQGMGQRMKLAFNRHGATGKHGWIWSWADSLWMHQYGHVSDGRYAVYRVAAERFRAHVIHAQRITVAHMEYTDLLVETLSVWRQDIHQQYELLDQIIDQYGRSGAAGEAGDDGRVAQANAEAQRLIELLGRPSPVRIEPFQG